MVLQYYIFCYILFVVYKRNDMKFSGWTTAYLSIRGFHFLWKSKKSCLFFLAYVKSHLCSIKVVFQVVSLLPSLIWLEIAFFYLPRRAYHSLLFNPFHVFRFIFDNIFSCLSTRRLFFAIISSQTWDWHLCWDHHHDKANREKHLGIGGIYFLGQVGFMSTSGRQLNKTGLTTVDIGSKESFACSIGNMRGCWGLWQYIQHLPLRQRIINIQTCSLCQIKISI